MAEVTPISDSSLLFEIGHQFSQLRFLAEMQWTDFDSDADNDDLRYVADLVRQLTALLEAFAQRQTKSDAAVHLSDFIKAVNAFWLHYRSAWRGNDRAAKLEELSRMEVEPEHEYERRRYLYEGSPLQDGHWHQVDAAAQNALSDLEPHLRACFQVSALLSSEVRPSFVGGQRLRDPELELGYLKVDFLAQVKQLLDLLNERFPFLSRLSLDLSDANVSSAVKSIDDFWQQIGDLLRNPSKAPGYLGLVLDRAKGRVSRGELSQTLLGSSETRWGLLSRLERSGPEPCSRAALERAWGLNYPSPAALDQALHELREILRPLGIRLDNKRGMGWTLEADQPAKTANPK